MKTTASFFAMKAVVVGTALLVTDAAMAQPAQPPAGAEVQPLPVAGGPAEPTSSNRWQSLPKMSADRCVAEAIGTAADPKTGAPARASIDPETGKPLCPPEQPTDGTKPR
jgi:hypothetical protein